MIFTKVQGLGNDFVLVNMKEVSPEEEQTLSGNLEQLAIKICDRHFGIGADGLVLLRPSQKADIAMQIINSDGSEAEMCGNAIRCVAKYAFERGLSKKTTMRVETAAGIMVPELILEGADVVAVRVDMGLPRLDREQIPMVGPPGKVINEPLEAENIVYNITAVSMGNPHCIIFVPDVDRVKLESLGPFIETHTAFPRKTNVEFVQVINDHEVRMRVWERGAGPTLACGTGACATAVAAALNGLTGRKVRVNLHAGPLDIEWAEDGRVYMTGPAQEVFNGNLPCLTGNNKWLF